MFSVELSLDRAQQEAELARVRNAALQEAVSRDGMTGLYNHAAFQKMLQQHANRGPLALVMLDVDDFKQYNDNHGHPAGDALLKALASLLQAQLRDEDGLARYGGEEFSLLLPGHDAQSAAAVAERLRRVVATYPAPHRPVTVSMGVAATPPLPPDPQVLVEAADRSLYQAKRLGKNRVVVSAEWASAPGVRPAAGPQTTEPQTLQTSS
jgi:diguanylate cyclase (GGDEF)-like protein